MIKNDDLKLTKEIILTNFNKLDFNTTMHVIVMSAIMTFFMLVFSFFLSPFFIIGWILGGLFLFFWIYEYNKGVFDNYKEKQIEYLNYLKVIDKEKEKDFLKLLKFKKDIEENKKWFLKNISENQKITFLYSSLIPYLNRTDEWDLSFLSARWFSKENEKLRVKIDDFNIARKTIFWSVKFFNYFSQKNIDLNQETSERKKIFESILGCDEDGLYISYPALVFYNYNKLIEKEGIKDLVEKKEFVIKDLNDLKNSDFQEKTIISLKLTNLEKEEIKNQVKQKTKEASIEDSKELYI